MHVGPNRSIIWILAALLLPRHSETLKRTTVTAGLPHSRVLGLRLARKQAETKPRIRAETDTGKHILKTQPHELCFGVG